MPDILREEAVRQAELRAKQGWTVYFKFTCEQCGQRCTLTDPNTLWEYGECFLCGYKTKLDIVGYLLTRTKKEV